MKHSGGSTPTYSAFKMFPKELAQYLSKNNFSKTFEKRHHSKKSRMFHKLQIKNMID